MLDARIHDESLHHYDSGTVEMLTLVHADTMTSEVITAFSRNCCSMLLLIYLCTFPSHISHTLVLRTAVCIIDHVMVYI